MNLGRFVRSVNVALAVVLALCAVRPAIADFNFVDVSYGAAEDLQLFGTNDKGLVTGTAFVADISILAFVYDPKKERVTELPPLPGCELHSMAINNSGIVVGNCQTSPNLVDGFILKGGAYHRFAYPEHERTYPRAIGATGLVTGFAQDDDTDSIVAFIYDPRRGTFTDILLPETSLVVVQFIAQGLNPSGRIVGNVVLMEPDESAFYWYGFVREPDGAVTLFQVNGQPTKARGITAAGLITGFTLSAAGSRVGFVGRIPGLGGIQVMTNVELFTVPFAGAVGTYPEAIDNSGRIVGGWMDESGHVHGFIATPVPKGRR